MSKAKHAGASIDTGGARPIRKAIALIVGGAVLLLGIALLVVALAYPLLAITSGRGVRQSEVFGLLPDPTALGTIGTLLLISGRWRRRLMIIPVAWCLISGAMLWAMRQENSEGRRVKGDAPHRFSLSRLQSSHQSVARIASRRS